MKRTLLFLLIAITSVRSYSLDVAGLTIGDSYELTQRKAVNKFGEAWIESRETLFFKNVTFSGFSFDVLSLSFAYDSTKSYLKMVLFSKTFSEYENLQHNENYDNDAQAFYDELFATLNKNYKLEKRYDEILDSSYWVSEESFLGEPILSIFEPIDFGGEIEISLRYGAFPIVKESF